MQALVRPVLEEARQRIASAVRHAEYKRIFEAVLSGDVEHIEDVVPIDAPEEFKRLVAGLASIVRDVIDGRMTPDEGIAAVARLIGFDPLAFIHGIVREYRG